MTFREWLSKKRDFGWFTRWTGRWLLPMVFYGLGLGFVYPVIGMKVGWMHQAGTDTTTTTDDLVIDQTTCQTILEPDGTVVDTCQDVTLTEEINIFEVDGFGLSELLLPVRLIVGLVFLAFAYKLTPKPK